MYSESKKKPQRRILADGTRDLVRLTVSGPDQTNGFQSLADTNVTWGDY